MPRMDFSLDSVQIASPCSANWDEMEGDDRVRFCQACSKHVYNLSEMTRHQAEELVHGVEGRLCVRFYRRPDGTMLTRDCPVGLQRWRRRLVMGCVAAGVLVVSLFGLTVGAVLSGTSRRDGGNANAGLLERLLNTLFPARMVAPPLAMPGFAPPPGAAMGGICAPPQPAPAPIVAPPEAPAID